MSRIADAAARSAALDGVALPPPAGDLDVAGDPRPPAEWRLEAHLSGEGEVRRGAVHRTDGPESGPEGRAHGLDPDLIELVQRVFRPGGPPLARVVTLAAVGHAAAPHRLGLSIARTLASYNAGTVCVVDAGGGPAGLNAPADAQPAGLGDMLCADVTSASVAVPVEHGIWQVPAGATAWPADWPDAVPRVIAVLADAFDFIIVATAAVEEPADVGAFLALASATDGVVITVDIRETRRDVAADVLSRVRAGGVEIFGAVTVQGHRRRANAGCRGLPA